MKSDFRKKIETLGGAKLNVIIKSKEEFTTSNKAIDQNISDVQRNFESQIPNSYINFIKDFGPITFFNSVITQGLEKIPVADENNTISVDNFFGFSDNSASITKVLNSFKGNIPDYVLPICEGAAGDLIVINLSAKENGKVFYWYHEHDDSTNGLYLIADSFDSFIKNLSRNEKIDENNTPSDEVKTTKVSDKFLERLKRSGKI